MIRRPQETGSKQQESRRSTHPMHALIRQLWMTIRTARLFPSPGPVVVAVSGGPDSVALLLGLSEIAPRLGIELIVAHLDHGLRPADGPQDAALVAELGGQASLPIEIGVARLPRQPGAGNLEELARDARYAFLAEVAERHGSATIALGHTAEDQAETLLMRLMRGAGPCGLAAMTPLAERPGLRLVRPLLSLSRSEIKRYLKSRQVVARLDRTNREITLSRNRVRHHLVPMLKREFNPQIIETLGRTADLMAEIDGYLERQGEDILDDGIFKHDRCGGATRNTGIEPEALGIEMTKVELDLPRLASYDPILQRYALRSALRRLRGDVRGIGFRHIDALVGLCRPGATGYQVELPGGAVGLREGRTLSLWLTPPTPGPPIEPVELPIPGTIQVHEAGATITARIFDAPVGWRTARKTEPCAWFDLDAIELPLVIRSRKPGDRILGHGLPREVKVKDLLIDAGVPRRLRETIPVLADRSRILWIAGVRRSAHALMQDSTKKVLEVTSSTPMFKPVHS